MLGASSLEFQNVSNGLSRTVLSFRAQLGLGFRCFSKAQILSFAQQVLLTRFSEQKVETKAAMGRVGRTITLRVQVPNNHILNQNLY